MCSRSLNNPLFVVQNSIWNFVFPNVSPVLCLAFRLSAKRASIQTFAFALALHINYILIFEWSGTPLQSDHFFHNVNITSQYPIARKLVKIWSVRKLFLIENFVNWLGINWYTCRSLRQFPGVNLHRFLFQRFCHDVIKFRGYWLK